MEAGSGFVSFGVTLAWNETKCVLRPATQSGLLLAWESLCMTVTVPVISDMPFFDATAASVVPSLQGALTLQWSCQMEDVFTPTVVVLLRLCDAKLVCTYTKEQRGRQGNPNSELRGWQTLSGSLPGLSWGTHSPMVQV